MSENTKTHFCTYNTKCSISECIHHIKRVKSFENVTVNEAMLPSKEILIEIENPGLVLTFEYQGQTIEVHEVETGYHFLANENCPDEIRTEIRETFVNAEKNRKRKRPQRVFYILSAVYTALLLFINFNIHSYYAPWGGDREVSLVILAIIGLPLLLTFFILSKPKAIWKTLLLLFCIGISYEAILWIAIYSALILGSIMSS